jgi:FtsZ-binding cell division protein ZapB
MAISHCNVGIEDFYGQPPEPSDEALEARDRIEELQERENDIRDAQDSWADLNSCLHHLGPLPPEISEGWDRIKTWLDRQARDTRDEMAYWQERESDAVWRWS